MNVQKFLASAQSKKLVLDYAVTCFYGKQYPLFFCYYYISFLQKQGIPVERCAFTGSDENGIKAQLSMESLCGVLVYWLNDFHTLPVKKQQEWLLYFKSYTGPHKLLLFCNDDAIGDLSQAEQCQTIMLDAIAAHDFTSMRFLVNGQGKEKTEFSNAVASYADRLSLDNTFLLIHYEMVVGKSVDDFFSSWFDTLIEPTSSLFLMAQHFFGKKPKAFFAQWSLVAEQYNEQFWVMFWFDQLWRASLYCFLMRQKQQAQAKKAQYKLPFSFINRDWSLYAVSELNAALQFLYDIDFRLKNGGNAVAFEHFYCMFFGNRFKKQ